MKPLKSKKLAGLIRQGSALLPLSARSQGLATNVSNAELEPQLGTTASPGPASAASRLSTPAGCTSFAAGRARLTYQLNIFIDGKWILSIGAILKLTFHIYLLLLRLVLK